MDLTMEEADSIGFGAVGENPENSVGFAGYSDFHTIDWQRDLARDRMRHRHILKKRHSSIWDTIKASIALALDVVAVVVDTHQKFLRLIII